MIVKYPSNELEKGSDMWEPTKHDQASGGKDSRSRIRLIYISKEKAWLATLGKESREGIISVNSH